MKKSIAVLGLGKYGRSLAENLYLMGADVLAVDSDEKVVNDFSGKCTSVVQANMENEEEVVALGLKNMDIVVSCTGTNIAAAIMSVAVAKEQGVPLTERLRFFVKSVWIRFLIRREREECDLQGFCFHPHLRISGKLMTTCMWWN